MSENKYRHSVVACAASGKDVANAAVYAQRIGIRSYDLLTIPSAATITPETATFLAKNAQTYFALHQVEHGLRVLLSDVETSDIRSLFIEASIALRKAFTALSLEQSITLEIPFTGQTRQAVRAVVIYCGDWAHRIPVHEALLRLGHNPYDLAHVVTPGGVALNTMQLAQMAALHNTDQAIIVLPQNCGAFGDHPRVTPQQQQNAEHVAGSLREMGFSRVEIVKTMS